MRNERTTNEPEDVVESTPLRPMKTVLLVDDENESRITTKWFLTNFGYLVDSAPSAGEALAVFDPKIHDVVVTDNSMPGMTGAELAHVIKLRSPSTPVLMYTGLAPEDRSCVDLVIQKPAHMLALKEGMDKLLAGRD
jgi:CheY-like chemotaxis protein